MEYLLLTGPGHNRLFLSAAPAAACAEIGALLPGAAVQPVTVAGLPYFSLSLPQPLSEEEARRLSQSAAFFALFQKEGELLRPIQTPLWRALPDSLNTILKYPGKTNEQFTRLLVNLACSVCRTQTPVPVLLDPMCGQGTTLFEAAIRGFDAIGTETLEQPAAKGADYFVKFLETGRYKHKRSAQRRSAAGRQIARLTAIEYACDKDDWYQEKRRYLHFYCADGSLCDQLLGKNTADLLVCDLPYGVQHGSRQQGTLHRNACGLVAQAAPGWARTLRHGAGVALAYNTLTTPRDELRRVLEAAGYSVCPQLSDGGLAHRVDQSILRDVMVAVWP